MVLWLLPACKIHPSNWHGSRTATTTFDGLVSYQHQNLAGTQLSISFPIAVLACGRNFFSDVWRCSHEPLGRRMMVAKKLADQPGSGWWVIAVETHSYFWSCDWVCEGSAMLSLYIQYREGIGLVYPCKCAWGNTNLSCFIWWYPCSLLHPPWGNRFGSASRLEGQVSRMPMWWLPHFHHASWLVWHLVELGLAWVC
jgi:hypothetical protein